MRSRHGWIVDPKTHLPIQSIQSLHQVAANLPFDRIFQPSACKEIARIGRCRSESVPLMNLTPASERLPDRGSITGLGVLRIPSTHSSLSLRGTRGPGRTSRRLPTTDGSRRSLAPLWSWPLWNTSNFTALANQDVVATGNDDVRDLDGLLE